MLSLITCLSMAIISLGAEKELADMIVRSAKTQTGLCLHVGAADGNLTLALSKRGRFLVYALETHPSRVRSAQELIRAAAPAVAHGPPSAGCLPEQRSLRVQR